MINIYKINKEKFKSIYFSVNFTMNVNSEKEVSENAVLSSLLSKSCKKYKNQMEIEKYLYSLYGAQFVVNAEKFGDVYNIEFAAEVINKKFLPEKKDTLREIIEFMYNIIFVSNLENKLFDDKLLEREKEVILEKIRTKKDEKLKYAVTKMEELMGKGTGFGMYLYGNEEAVKNISNKELYEAYKRLLNNSCVTVILSGNLEGYDDVEGLVKEIFKEELDSKISYEDLITNASKEETKLNKIEEVEEKSDTTQSVLSLGLGVEDYKIEEFYALNLYNAILGATPSSKLFQNFREKESLAYTVRSRYYRFKYMLVIYAGIENKNYKKAIEVIKKQINDIKDAKVTKEEFNAAKESLIADLNEWDDSKIALAKMLLSNLFIYKDNSLKIEDMIKKMQAVTLEEVIAVAQKVKLEKIFFLGGEENE